MADFIRVCNVDQVPVGTPLTVEINGRPVAIVEINGSYYSFEDICPHQGSSFEDGSLDGEIVTCPLHGWKLNAVTGESLEAPGIKIETFEVKVEGDSIYIRL